jgi:hypothetical protein
MPSHSFKRCQPDGESRSEACARRYRCLHMGDAAGAGSSRARQEDSQRDHAEHQIAVSHWARAALIVRGRKRFHGRQDASNRLCIFPYRGPSWVPRC